MRKRIIVIILALGLVSFCVVSSIISANQSEQDRLTANATQNAYNDAASATFTAIDVEAAATNTEAPTATAIANTEATQTALQIALTPTPSTVTVDLLTAVNERLVTVSFMSTGG